MIGAAIGAAAGAVSLILLIKFTSALGAGDKMPVLPVVLQPLIIMVALLLAALTVPGELVWAGVALAGVLIIGAVVKLSINMSKNKRDKNGKKEA